MTHKIAILASGSGTTAEAVAQSIEMGELDAEISVIIHDRVDAQVVNQPTIIKQRIPTLCINKKTHPKTESENLAIAEMTAAESRAVADAVEASGAELVVLLGYMRKVTGDLLARYGFDPKKHTKAADSRMLNTHPGPLPQTKGLYGSGVHAKVYELMNEGQIDRSGPTLHAVAADYDTGPIFRYADTVGLVAGEDSAQSIEDKVREVERAVTGPELQEFLTERHQKAT